MDLKTYYLGLPPTDRSAFADRAGTTMGYLSLVINGHRRASPELARKLYDASGKTVPLGAIRPDIWPTEEAASCQ